MSHIYDYKVHRCYKRDVLPHCTSHKSKDYFFKHLFDVIRLLVLVLVVVAKCMIFCCFYTDYMLVLRYIQMIVCNTTSSICTRLCV